MSKKAEIKGYPVYQCCNNANSILQRKYDTLKAEEDKLRMEIRERENRIEAIREEYKDLNKAEVDTVLDYVRSYTRADILSKNDIDVLLCHCQNKLKGNINSTFLQFNSPEQEE